MGHVPVSGPGGSLRLLASLPGRSFYVHLNNTNPLLDARSEQAAAVARASVGVAMDGMEIEL
jgi:pyrroloquinoline quinone biosynthesis protein B